MLRMIQCQSAKQAKEYHKDELSQSDYYTDGQELQGRFYGRVADRLGIAGEATRATFNRLCDNRHPLTRSPLTQRNVRNRTVGYDINFHCPKSVSVLHVLSKDDHVLEAFQQCVNDTMLDIEADSKTRVRKQGKDEDRATGELVWTSFIHQTARPVKEAEPDPHLHCHCFTFNVTWDEAEQQYKAGQFRDIKRDMPYYQSRFHKRLADALIDLGYRVRRTKTSFEVVGVPVAAIKLLSKRTNEIGQIAKEYGITDPKALDSLGAKTRVKKKKGLTMADLKKDWRRQILALTTDNENSSEPIRHSSDIPCDILPQMCVDYALQYSFERASVVQDRRILATAYSEALGYTGATVDEITKAFHQDDQIISAHEGSMTLCTTAEVLAQEQKMISLAVAGKGQVTPLYKQLPILFLQGEQAKAVMQVLTTTDQVSIISGRAGTGKTTLMKEAVSKIEAIGKKVIMVAPTAQASRGVLKEEGFAEAETVSKLLTDPAIQKGLTDQVLWVDEAGLLGVRDMTALLELSSKHKARLILSGDTRQHSSVVRGDALRVLQSVGGIVPAEINQIYRQRNMDYRQAVDQLSRGNVKSAFSGLERMGSIKVADASYTQLVNDYLAAFHQGKSVLAVSPTHAQCDQVTAAIRSALQDAGKLDTSEQVFLRLINRNLTEAEKTKVTSYETGHVIRFNQNRERITRGSAWVVSDVSGKEVMIENENKKTLLLSLNKTTDFDVYDKIDIRLSKGDRIMINRNSFDENKKRLSNGQVFNVVDFTKNHIVAANEKSHYILPADIGHISHAYCVTSHAAQGKTVDEIFIAQPASTFIATDMKQFYVSVSRGRDNAHIYTDDKEALLEHASTYGDRLSAVELIKPSKEWMMRKRRDKITGEQVIGVTTPSQVGNIALNRPVIQ